MKALVTGVAGFIGSTLAAQLLRDGVDVVGVDNFSSYYDRALKAANLARLGSSGFRFIEGDLNSLELDPLLDGTDAVYHLAGQPGVRGSWGESFAEYTAANIEATQRVLEAARRVGRGPRLVYASSSSVYGDAESYPTSEDLAPRPRSPYGVTKLAGEHLWRLYASNYDLDTVSLRFFTVYGPRQRPDMAFTRFLRAAVAGAPIAVYGSGEQVRDFTFVTDVVDAVIRAGTARDLAKGAVYNVSGGGSHSVNQVLDMIAELTGAPLNVERSSAAMGDVARTSADTSAIQRDLSWNPRVTLREGLQEQLAWVRATEDFGV